MLTKPHPLLTPIEAVRVLAVGLRPGEVRAFRQRVAGQPGIRISGGRSLAEALAFIEGDLFDVVLAEAEVWASDGGGIRSAIEARRGDMGVVLAGEAGRPLSGEQLVELAANDWISRSEGDGAAILASITGAWSDSRTARRRHTMARWLERDARTDHLTGFYNRHAFEEELEHVCGVSRRAGTPVTLLMIDVSGTRSVNDAYGREAGDRMIARAASVVARCIRAKDFAARIGGDDMCVILAEDDIELGKRVARRIAQEMERANSETWGDEIPVSVGFGVASGIACTAHALFEAAEVQLRRHKQAARPIPFFAQREHDHGPSVA